MEPKWSQAEWDEVPIWAKFYWENNRWKKTGCTFVMNTGCLIYDWRPFFCRIFGIVEKDAQCDIAKPDRYLTPIEIGELVVQYKRLWR